MKFVLALAVETIDNKKLLARTWDCETWPVLQEEYSRQKKVLAGKFRAFNNIISRENQDHVAKFKNKLNEDFLELFGPEEIHQFYFEWEAVPETPNERIYLFEQRFPELCK